MTQPPTFKDQKITSSNSSLTPGIERKYIIELIPVKSYKKRLAFLVSMTLKDITNRSLNLAKVFSQYSFPFKAIVSLYSSVSQYSGTIRSCTKYASWRNSKE